MKSNPDIIKKLYWTDSYLFTFDAHITEIRKDDEGNCGIILDRTAFYPESGGQPWDMGTIENVPVFKVVEEKGEIVHHISEGCSLKKGSVSCVINAERRIDHMQQHTGQHILSQSFLRILNAATVSFHLGADDSSIDIDSSHITAPQIGSVEQEANRIIYKNLTVMTDIVESSEINKYNLRKKPVQKGSVRIVSIGDYDHTPCGGTHLKNTGSAGAVKIVKYERYKGHYRIYFYCGSRAFHDYANKHSVLMELAQTFTSGWENIPGIVSKLREENAHFGKKLHLLQKSALPAEAEILVKGGEHVGEYIFVQKLYPDKEKDEIGKLAGLLMKSPRVICFLTVVDGEKVHTVLGKGEEVPLDMRIYLNCFLEGIDGRGGGKPEMVRGGGNMVENLEHHLDKTVKLILNDLHNKTK